MQLQDDGYTYVEIRCRRGATYGSLVREASNWLGEFYRAMDPTERTGSSWKFVTKMERYNNLQEKVPPDELYTSMYFKFKNANKMAIAFKLAYG